MRHKYTSRSLLAKRCPYICSIWWKYITWHCSVKRKLLLDFQYLERGYGKHIFVKFCFVENWLLLSTVKWRTQPNLILRLHVDQSSPSPHQPSFPLATRSIHLPSHPRTPISPYHILKCPHFPPPIVTLLNAPCFFFSIFLCSLCFRLVHFRLPLPPRDRIAFFPFLEPQFLLLLLPWPPPSILAKHSCSTTVPHCLCHLLLI